MKTVEIRGNTYPVRAQLHQLGAQWDADSKCWRVAEDKAEEARKLVAGAPEKKFRGYTSCKVCGAKATRYSPIYRTGECRDCYEERKMGY